MKIKGEFLKIENLSNGEYEIYYRTHTGQVGSMRLNKSDFTIAEKARRWLKEETEKPEGERNEGRIEVFTFHSLWPEMFASYCKGESLDKFFTGKQRILWKGQKQEWIFEMRKLYDKNQKRYKSLRDTIKQEFPKYEFKGGWTVSRALNLLYRVSH